MDQTQSRNGHGQGQTVAVPPSGRTGLARSESASGRRLFLPATPRLAVVADPAGAGAENFRLLAASVRYFQQQQGAKRLVLASAIQGEGKSVTSANLAITLARRQEVLLVDGDLRRSGLKSLLNTQGLRGLTNWWRTTRSISDYLHRFEGTSLWYLPSGDTFEQPLEILQSERILESLAQLADRFEWLIIDTPPLEPVADCFVWVTHADGTLLVAREGMTPKKVLKRTLESSENLKLIGLVMNGSRKVRLGSYARYYRHQTSRNVDVLAQWQLPERDFANLGQIGPLRLGRE